MFSQSSVTAATRAMRALFVILIIATAISGAAGCGDDDPDPDLALDEAQQQVESEQVNLINQDYEVTLVNLTYPYTPSDSRFTLEEGYQQVLVTVSIRNTGEYAVVASFADFILEASDGQRYLAIPVTDLEEDFGAARSPIPGSEETGTLVFEIPLTAAPVALLESIGPETRRIELPAAAS